MLILISILIGLISSFISSILGGGFGLLSVPSIFWLISHFYPNSNHVMQIAMATSGFSSIALGITASYKQIKYRNVDFKLLKKTIYILLISALIGVYMASIFSSQNLKIFFGIIVFAIACWMITFNPNKPKIIILKKTVFKIMTAIVGFISCLVGVSVFTVPFFIITGTEIKKAIGTSTVLVFIYSSISAIFFVILGVFTIGIHGQQIGYLNLPIFLSALIPCVIGSLIGAKCVKILPPNILKIIFISLMFLVSAIMLI